jgi:hypothetical protein
MPRFQVSSDNLLFVFFFAHPVDRQDYGISKNRVLEICSDVAGPKVVASKEP